jgi:hypothetical protein
MWSESGVDAGLLPLTEAHITSSPREGIMFSKRMLRAMMSFAMVAAVVSCGDSTEQAGLGSGNSRAQTKAVVNTAVVAIQIVAEDNSPVPDVVITLSRAVSGAAARTGWSGTTNSDGQTQITVQVSSTRRDTTGYYTAVATDDDDNVLSRWTSIPVNVDGKNVLTCRIGGDVTVHPRGPIVRIMTRNLYLGADINRVLLAEDPAKIPLLVAQTWGVVQQTNFAERAETIADEIEAAKPHLVGLQEVSLFRMEDPGDLLMGGQTLPTEIVIDFLQILLDTLGSRGLSYEAVAVSEGIDIELPLAKSATEFADIRLTDREVILARSDVQISNAVEGQYQAALPIEVGGVPTSILRAYASVQATVSGRDIRFITTHLETGSAEPIQAIQAGELVQLTAADPLPVITVGDFNSDARGTTTDTYADILIPGGLVDVWNVVNPNNPGLTGSQQEDLLNASTLSKRIDLIFVRGSDDLSSLKADVVGDDEAARTPSGLWPSDHAGVTASIRLPSFKPF